jgi:hypothetical protein
MWLVYRVQRQVRRQIELSGFPSGACQVDLTEEKGLQYWQRACLHLHVFALE